MIEKERLEELIEQGATVCNAYKDWDNVWHCRFGNVVQEETHLLFKENGSSLSAIMYNTNNLYETKEHAEWEWEFGCIERTERLELPTWEEIQSNALYNVYFTTPEIEVYRLIFNTTRETITISVQDENFDFENRWLLMETYKLTKENYTLACRKAKELFLGENK